MYDSVAIMISFSFTMFTFLFRGLVAYPTRRIPVPDLNLRQNWKLNETYLEVEGWFGFYESSARSVGVVGPPYV